MLDIVETTGVCQSCGKDGILGDGFCRKCWDRGENTILTDREKEVLSHLARGAANIDIAKSMRLSLSTIENYTQSLIRKICIPKGINKRVWLAVNARCFLGGNGHESV